MRGERLGNWKRLGLNGVGLLVAATLNAAPTPPVVHVATLQDGPSAELEERLPDYQEEILALTRGELEVRFEPRHQRVSDWSAAGVSRAADELLADPDVDLIVAFGVMASQELCCRGDLPRPAIAVVVLDAELQGFSIVEGHSGVRNLSFLAMPRLLRRDLETFAELVPLRRVAFLGGTALNDAVPTVRRANEELMRDLGFEVVVATGDSVDELVSAIPEGVDGVYVFPLLRLALAERERVFAGLAARGLPTFSWLGRSEVEAGALMGLSIDVHRRLSRRVALNAQRILLGEAPEELPVAFPMPARLSLNVEVARRIGFSPRWQTLVEAELFGSWEPPDAVVLSLPGAVDEAVAANLDLLAGQRGVAAAGHSVEEARSRLLPQLDVDALGVAIDEDRAASLLSPQAQRTASASITLRQLLWSDPAWANLEIQDLLQRSREADLAALRLDVVQAAAVAYFDVLRALTLEQVRRDNLALSRSHRELTEVRLQVGKAVEAELVRWDSRIASDRAALVEAHAQRELATLVLARLLHRRLSSPLRVEPVSLDDPLLVTHDRRLAGATATPRMLERTADFLVATGLAGSPELDQLDALVSAKAREHESARRAFWSPTVALSAEVEETLAESGAGAGGPPPLPFSLRLPDDRDFVLALTASLPLFDGGGRRSRERRAAGELAELEARRAGVAERLELRIRAATVQAVASFHAIGLSRAAAAAAARNLELVTDAYARGALAILDLLDAQNAALVAELGASNAAFDFLVDLMEVERSIHRFDFFLTAEERTSWLDELQGALGGSERPALEPPR